MKYLLKVWKDEGRNGYDVAMFRGRLLAFRTADIYVETGMYIKACVYLNNKILRRVVSGN